MRFAKLIAYKFLLKYTNLLFFFLNQRMTIDNRQANTQLDIDKELTLRLVDIYMACPLHVHQVKNSECCRCTMTSWADVMRHNVGLANPRQKDRLKVMHMSPPCKVHRWPEKKGKLCLICKKTVLNKLSISKDTVALRQWHPVPGSSDSADLDPGQGPYSVNL